jgi:hypothetical protein
METHKTKQTSSADVASLKIDDYQSHGTEKVIDYDQGLTIAVFTSNSEINPYNIKAVKIANKTFPTLLHAIVYSTLYFEGQKIDDDPFFQKSRNEITELAETTSEAFFDTFRRVVKQLYKQIDEIPNHVNFFDSEVPQLYFLADVLNDITYGIPLRTRNAKYEEYLQRLKFHYIAADWEPFQRFYSPRNFAILEQILRKKDDIARHYMETEQKETEIEQVIFSSALPPYKKKAKRSRHRWAHSMSSSYEQVTCTKCGVTQNRPARKEFQGPPHEVLEYDGDHWEVVKIVPHVERQAGLPYSKRKPHQPRYVDLSDLDEMFRSIDLDTIDFGSILGQTLAEAGDRVSEPLVPPSSPVFVERQGLSDAPTSSESGGAGNFTQGQGEIDSSEYSIKDVLPATASMKPVTQSTILDTSYYFETVSWSTNSPRILYTIKVPNDPFDKIDFAGVGLRDYYTYIRTNFNFVVSVSAPRQAVGELLIVVDPRPECENFPITTYDCTAMNLVHSSIVLGGQNQGEITAPYVELTRCVPFRNTPSFSAIRLLVWNPLRFAEPTSVNVSISFQFKDPHVSFRNIPLKTGMTREKFYTAWKLFTGKDVPVQLQTNDPVGDTWGGSVTDDMPDTPPITAIGMRGPIHPDMAHQDHSINSRPDIIRQADSDQAELARDNNPNKGQVRDMQDLGTFFPDKEESDIDTSNLETESAEQQFFPLIAGFGLLAGGIAACVNAARGIKAMAAGKQDTPEIAIGPSNSTVVQGPVAVGVLGAANKEQHIDCKDVISIPPHSGSISDIISIPSRVAKFTWSASQGNGDILYSAPISPCQYHPGVEKIEFAMSNLEFFASFFSMWSGTLHYKLKLLVNMFHQGSLYCAILPQYNCVGREPTLEQVKNLEHFSLVLESKSDVSFKFHTPYVTDTDAKRCVFIGDADIGKSMPEAVLGTLIVYVQNPLTVVDKASSNTVDINLYQWAEKDFKFIQPHLSYADNESQSSGGYGQPYYHLYPTTPYNANTESESEDPVLMDGNDRVNFYTNQGGRRDVQDLNTFFPKRVEVQSANFINIKYAKYFYLEEEPSDNEHANFTIYTPHTHQIQLQPQSNLLKGIKVRWDTFHMIITYPSFYNINDSSEEKSLLFIDQNAGVRIVPGVKNKISLLKTRLEIARTEHLLIRPQPQPKLETPELILYKNEYVVSYPQKANFVDRTLVKVEKQAADQLDISSIETPVLVLDHTNNGFCTTYTRETMNIYNLLKRPMPYEKITDEGKQNGPKYFTSTTVIRGIPNIPRILMMPFYAKAGSDRITFHSPSGIVGGHFVSVFTDSKNFSETSSNGPQAKFFDFPIVSTKYMYSNKVMWSASEFPTMTVVRKYYYLNPLIRTGVQVESPSEWMPIVTDKLAVGLSNPYRREINVYPFYTIGEDFTLHYLLPMPTYYLLRPKAASPVLSDPPIPGLVPASEPIPSFFNPIPEEVIDVEQQATTEDVVQKELQYLSDYIAEDTEKIKREADCGLFKTYSGIDAELADLKQTKIKPDPFHKESVREDFPDDPSFYSMFIDKIKTVIGGVTSKLVSFKNFITKSFMDKIEAAIFDGIFKKFYSKGAVKKIIKFFRVIFLLLWLVRQITLAVSQKLGFMDILFNFSALLVAGCDSKAFCGLIKWLKKVTIFQSQEDSFGVDFGLKIVKTILGIFKIPAVYSREMISGFFRGVGMNAAKDTYTFIVDKIKGVFNWLFKGSDEPAKQYKFFNEIMPIVIDEYESWDKTGALSDPRTAFGQHTEKLAEFLKISLNISKGLKRLEGTYPLLFRDKPAWGKFVKNIDEYWAVVVKREYTVERPEPVGVLLAGTAGVGKSILATEILPSLILQRVGYIEKREFFKKSMYNIPNDPDQKFFDNYYGQPWTVYDDLGASAEGKDWVQMINLISTAVAPINQAHLTDKGMVFTSPFVCATTNQTAQQGITGVQDIEAIDRRFLKYKITVSTAYSDPSAHCTRRLNTKKLFEDAAAASNVAEEISIYDKAFVISRFSYKNEKENSRICFSEMFKEIVQQHVTRRKNLVKFQARLNNQIKAVSTEKEESAYSKIKDYRAVGEFKSVHETAVKYLEQFDHDLDDIKNLDSALSKFKKTAYEFTDNDSDDEEEEPDSEDEYELPLDAIEEVDDKTAEPQEKKEVDWTDPEVVVKNFLNSFSEDTPGRFFTRWAKAIPLEKLELTKMQVASFNVVEVVTAETYEDFSLFYNTMKELDDAGQQYFLLRHFIIRAHIDKSRGVKWSDNYPFHFLSWRDTPCEDFTLGARFLDLKVLGPRLKTLAEPIGYLKPTRWTGITTVMKIFSASVIYGLGIMASFIFVFEIISLIERFFPSEQQGYSIKDTRATPRIVKSAQQQSNTQVDVWNRNVLYIFSEHKQFLVNGFAISNNFILAPAHTITQRDKILITFPTLKSNNQKFVTINYSRSDYRVLKVPGDTVSADIVLMRLPLALPSVRNRMTQFFTTEQFDTITAGCVKKVKHFRSAGFLPFEDAEGSLVSYYIKDDRNQMGFHTKGIKVIFPPNVKRTTPGTCGTYYAYNDKLVGFHTLGSPVLNTTYFAPVTQDTLQEAIDTFKDDIDHTIEIVDDARWESADCDGITYIGKDPSIQVSIPTKTEFIKSPFYNENLKDGHSPPVMNKKTLVDEEAAKYKIDRDIVIPDLTHFNMVQLEFETLMATSGKVSRLSEDVVLNGSDEIGMAPMDLDTSAGFWRCNGSGKKAILNCEYVPNKFLTINEETKHPILGMTVREAITRTEENYVLGYKIADDYWQCSLKDELRKEGKTARAFECSSFVNTYLAKKYLGHFISTYRSRAGPGLGHAIGTDRNQVWKIIYETLYEMGKGKVVDLDYSKYDGSIGPLFFYLFHRAVYKYYRNCNDPDGDKIRFALVHDLQHSFHILADEIFMSHKGNNSGSWLTDAFNSFVNNFLIRSAYYYQQNKYFGNIYYNFNDHVCIYTYGDDVILAFSPGTRTWLNMYLFVMYIKDLGFNVTAADKSEDITEKHIDESTFLKSGFKIQDGMVLAPLPKEIIYREINWMRKVAIQDRLVQAQRLRDALRFSVHHGQEFFLDIFNAIFVRCANYPEIFSYVNSVDYHGELNNIFYLQQSVTVKNRKFCVETIDHEPDIVEYFFFDDEADAQSGPESALPSRAVSLTNFPRYVSRYRGNSSLNMNVRDCNTFGPFLE